MGSQGGGDAQQGRSWLTWRARQLLMDQVVDKAGEAGVGEVGGPTLKGR